MDAYRTEKIGPDKFELLVPLMKDCFGMEVNIGYFQWKYISNPAGSFIGFIAVHNETGEVGAYYGVIPQQFIINGKPQTIYQSCDTMTHSGHRRKGLFQKLATECFDYLRASKKLFIIGFGGGQSTPGFLKFGWKHIFDIRYYFKPSLFCRLSKFTATGNVERTTDFKLLEELASTSVSKAAVYSARSATHLKWRSSNPLYQYHVILYKQQQQAEGYLIYYTSGDKIILFDFVFNSNSAARALTAFIGKEVIKNRCRGIVSFCKENGSHARNLKANGFIANPFKKGPLWEKTPFIIYAEEEVMQQFSAADKWEVSAYDHDAM